jgi:hypothetical protein
MYINPQQIPHRIVVLSPVQSARGNLSRVGLNQALLLLKLALDPANDRLQIHVVQGRPAFL